MNAIENKVVALVSNSKDGTVYHKMNFNKEFKLGFMPDSAKGKQFYIGLESARDIIAEDSAFYNWLSKLEVYRGDVHIRKFRRGFALRVTRK